MQKKKRPYLILSFCFNIFAVIILSFLQIQTPVFASSDSEQKSLENEITQIFKDKAGAKTDKSITFEFLEELTEEQKIEKLNKLHSRLYKTSLQKRRSNS